MNRNKQIVFAALALSAALATGAAQARDVSVQWAVNIGGPIGVSIYSQPPRVYAPQVVLVPRAVYPVVRGGDRDHDGIPNRYDRVYNPRWDRDGDGVPNRHDRYDNRGHDRDHDGVPNWRDRNDRPGRGR